MKKQMRAKKRASCKRKTAGFILAATTGVLATAPAFGQYTINTLATFNGDNGANPYAGLTVSGSTLYGTTYVGGADGDGTVFSVPVAGGSPTTLVTFNGSNGAHPIAGLTLSDGTLYGTTVSGGAGYGTVFSVPVTGGTPATVVSFNGSNGAAPYGSLTFSGNTLYGTTKGGGSNYGTVFSYSFVNKSLTTLLRLTPIYGEYPEAALTLLGNGRLYGTTTTGGEYGLGNVFSVGYTGSSPAVLATFNGSSGESSYAGLTYANNTLYGTTETFGAGGYGGVFSLPVTGGTTTTLATFNNSNGGTPYAGLTLSGSILYGTTEEGGANGYGTVFSVPITGGSPTTLATFNGSNGAYPYAGLTLSGNTLYGTTSGGGANGSGTVFSIVLNGGSWLNTSNADNDWATNGNWSNALAPTSAGAATFDQSATYAVGFSSASTANSLTVSAGNVTLNLSGQTLTISGTGNPLLVNGSGSGPSLLINGGTINFGTDNGSIVAGGGGSGTLTIQNGAVINYLNGHLNAGDNGTSGTGLINITGPGTTVNVGNTYAGAQAMGTINISNGATVNTGNFTVGALATGFAYVGGGAGISTVNASGGVVALGGYYDADEGQTGILTIYSGGLVIASTTTVWNASSQIELSGGYLKTGFLNTSGGTNAVIWTAGTVELTSSDADFGQTASPYNTFGFSSYTLGSGKSLNVSGSGHEIDIGVNTTGELDLSAGASIAASHMQLGYSSNGAGTMKMDGAATVCSTTVTYIGLSGSGNLQMTNGATLNGANMLLGANAGSSGTVNVSSGSAINLTGDLSVAGYIGTQGGSGNLTVINGTVTVPGTTQTWNNGTITLPSAGGTFNTSTLTLSGGLFNLAGGTLTAAAINTLGVATRFNFSSGALNLTGSNYNFGGGLTIPAQGTVNLSGQLSVPVTINNGGTFNLNRGSGSGILQRNIASITTQGTSLTTCALNMEAEFNPSNRQLLVLGALNIAYYQGLGYYPEGRFDLGNNDMVIQANGSVFGGTPLTLLLEDGFDFGKWDAGGPTTFGGICSSSAAADPTHLHGLGYLYNQGTLSTFDGYSVGYGDTLVKYTYYGDANLDGKVDGSDYTRIDSGFLTHSTGWFNGDFNYDGVVNGSDYTLIDNAFNRQGASLTSEVATPTGQIAPVAVPEPSSIVLGFFACIGLLGKGRHTRQHQHC